MKQKTNILKNLIRKGSTRCRVPSAKALTFGATVALVLSACSMINEELPECAPAPRMYTVVNFEYTYNMKNEDWFDDHAGSVYLYVFDEDGTYLLRKEKTKNEMEDLNNVDFSIILDDTELIPGSKYQFVAMAQGNYAGYDYSLNTPGFTLQTEMVPGFSKIEDYRVKLDRNDDGIYDLGFIDEGDGVFEYKDAYDGNRIKLDTLWSTKPNSVQWLDIPYIAYKPQIEQLPDIYNEVTVPMMRITNSIKVNLVNDYFGQDTDPNDYNIVIEFPEGNGTIGFTGTVYSIQKLLYLALRKKVNQYQDKNNGAHYDADLPSVNQEAYGTDMNYFVPGTRAGTYCINAEFGVSRMQTTDGSSLKIYTKNDEVNPIVTIDDFSYWLADYFSHDYNFDEQQFLDREYDFTVDIHLEGDGSSASVDWIQVGCNILGWGKRRQNVILK